ncbi:MAG: amidohydrolase [Pirellulaceae bacterium]|nr:amidohydrolase [Planctomycetales bacterium]
MSTLHATWQNELIAAVDADFERIVQMRRHLHRYPEVSGEEYRTSLYLYQQLSDDGVHVTMGPEGRGVIADLCDPDTAAEGSVFVLRADIDALRIQDAKRVDYCSQHAGVMHACGHDAHASCSVGALRAIAALYRTGSLPLKPAVRAIFQPAEEICQGAVEMLQAGALQDAGAILAAHVDPTRRAGTVGVRDGVLTASCDEMVIVIEGEGGHAARPHESRDPIAAAAMLINVLYQQIPRTTDSQDAVVVTIGQIQGGHTSNVIPEHVQLAGTMRTLDRAIREQTMERISRIANAVALATQTEIQVKFGVGTGPICNDARLMSVVREQAQAVLGADRVREILRPSMGSEDFAFYLERIPGAMFRLGCASELVGSAGLHTSMFDIDEQCLAVGTKLLAATAVAWTLSQAGLQ